jgi:hypothetical protein
MRRIALTLMAFVLLVEQPVPRPRPKNQPHHPHTRYRNPGAWDPGYTLDNPFGLPPWMRRPVRPLPGHVPER